MRTAGGFVGRLILYAIVLTLVLLLARFEWNALGLDTLAGGGDALATRLARFYGRLPVVVAFAAVVAAALGALWRHLGTLLLWVAIAALVTAPIAIARIVAG
ncbi:MAG: hypothetical protein ABI346_02085 [Candidatus Baltobacteraceae bacterium]|jgi:phosphoglycerol transferase MdoB-like AlkP superfamily enzyme